jgi:hypothetical protein
MPAGRYPVRDTLHMVSPRCLPVSQVTSQDAPGQNGTQTGQPECFRP